MDQVEVIVFLLGDRVNPNLIQPVANNTELLSTSY